MFTGIIEETGSLDSIRRGSVSCSMSIKGNLIFDDLKIGDSVSVNGICLTATRIDAAKKVFDVDVMAETLRRTNLGSLTTGSSVNLERAMAAGGRFGGHIVSGHIDGTGRITDMKREGNAVWVTVSTPPEILRYIVEKGSIAIDGISLTVAGLGDGFFKVSVIPHTGEETILLNKHVGDIVNLENDIISKYVEKLLKPYTGSGEEKTEEGGGLTLDMLVSNGFM